VHGFLGHLTQDLGISSSSNSSSNFHSNSHTRSCSLSIGIHFRHSLPLRSRCSVYRTANILLRIGVAGCERLRFVLVSFSFRRALLSPRSPIPIILPLPFCVAFSCSCSVESPFSSPSLFFLRLPSVVLDRSFRLVAVLLGAASASSAIPHPHRASRLHVRSCVRLVRSVFRFVRSPRSPMFYRRIIFCPQSLSLAFVLRVYTC